MKTKLLSLFCLFGLLLSVAGSNSYATQGFKKEKRNVGAFESIGLAISADLYLTQGSNTEVILEAEDKIIDKIKTEVKNGTLKIYYDNWTIRNYKRVKIYVTNPTVNGLSVSGSGDIIAETKIQSEKIDFKISGSGGINIDELETNTASAGISGSGEISLTRSGRINSFEVSISGSGDLMAEGVEIEAFKARISGSGSCSVHVTSSLDASISGSGKIYYQGKPTIDARISGSGKIISR